MVSLRILRLFFVFVVVLCGISIFITSRYILGCFLQKHCLKKVAEELQDHTNQTLDRESFSACTSEHSTNCVSTYSKEVVAERARGEDEGGGCIQSAGIPKSWSQGVVTVLQPQVKVNCSKILEGEKHEVARVKEAMLSWKSALSSPDLLQKVQNCSWLREYMAHNFYNSKLEREFPLAFTLLVYDSPEQILRLLRVLYRTQNSFCIHCDAKSPHLMLFQSIASCFDNVVVPSLPERVIWGHSSILVAEMKCMTELIKLRETQTNKWQYLLNLCGKELPLATNREMVMQLIKLNGTSNMITEIMTMKDTESMDRIKYRVKLDKSKTRILPHDRSSPTINPPFNVSKYYRKSSGYHALSFQFTYHLTHNDTAIMLRKFFLLCRVPEEHYYATVFMIPGVHGGYSETMGDYFSVRNIFWMPPHSCSGKSVHEICVVSAGDLASVLPRRGGLFHNKYFMELDHSVMNCMEEKLVAKNKKEYDTDCTPRTTQSRHV